MQDRFTKVETTLAATVADDGTLVIAYPSGTSQATFNRGLNKSGSYVIINNNDKWSEGDPGISVTYGASDITITNLSGVAWAAGSDVLIYLNQQDGNDVLLLTIPVALAAIASAGDVVTNIRPGVYGWIEDWEFVVTRPVTTASRLATLNLEINTTNVTGGAIALTSAAATPLGKSIAGAAITAANYITPSDTLSVEAASVTAFAEGEGFLLIRIRKDPAYAG